VETPKKTKSQRKAELQWLSDSLASGAIKRIWNDVTGKTTQDGQSDSEYIKEILDAEYPGDESCSPDLS